MVNVLKLYSDSCLTVGNARTEIQRYRRTIQELPVVAKGSALRRNPGRHSQKTPPNPSCCGRPAAGPSLPKPERKPYADEKNG
jgi:hypothetical protein